MPCRSSPTSASRCGLARGVQAGVVQLRAAAAGLRLVHRGVGALDQQVGVHARAPAPKLIPIDRPTSTSTPSIGIGCSSASCSRRAAPSARVRLVIPGSRTANSSPPRRASVSPLAERPGQPVADVAQQQVTELVPERVVDLPEADQVQHEHGQAGGALGAHVLQRLADRPVAARRGWAGRSAGRAGPRAAAGRPGGRSAVPARPGRPPWPAAGRPSSSNLRTSPIRSPARIVPTTPASPCSGASTASRSRREARKARSAGSRAPRGTSSGVPPSSTRDQTGSCASSRSSWRRRSRPPGWVSIRTGRSSCPRRAGRRSRRARRAAPRGRAAGRRAGSRPSPGCWSSPG